MKSPGADKVIIGIEILMPYKWAVHCYADKEDRRKKGEVGCKLWASSNFFIFLEISLTFPPTVDFYECATSDLTNVLNFRK